MAHMPLVDQTCTETAYTQYMNKGDWSQHHVLGMTWHVPAYHAVHECGHSSVDNDMHIGI